MLKLLIILLRPQVLLLGALGFITSIFIFLFLKLITFKSTTNTKHLLRFYTAILVLCALKISLSWMILLILAILQNNHAKIALLAFNVRQAFSIIEYLFIPLFVDALIRPTITLSIGGLKKIHFLFLSILAILYLVGQNMPQTVDVSTFLIDFYGIVVLLASSYFLYRSIKKESAIPLVVKKELTTLTRKIFFPYVLSSILVMVSRDLPYNALFFSAVLSLFIKAYLWYFCKSRIMKLPFFTTKQNALSHVFIEDLNKAFEGLTHALNMSEIERVTKQFFQDSFNVSPLNVSLHIRSAQETYLQPQMNKREKEERHKILSALESTLDSSDLEAFLEKNKMLKKDDLAFAYFYELKSQLKVYIDFLETINASFFIAIYNQKRISAYLILRDTSINCATGSAEGEKILLFTAYLERVLTFMETIDPQAALKKYQALKRETHYHAEKLAWYESIIASISPDNLAFMGALLYNNDKLSYLNQESEEQIGIKLSKYSIFAENCTFIAKEAQNTGSPKTLIIKDERGRAVKLKATPCFLFESKEAIVTVQQTFLYPLQNHENPLYAHLDWNMILRLETTQAGQLINQALPGSSPALLALKVSILKAVLSPKAVWIEAPGMELMKAADIIYKASSRPSMAKLSLKEPENKEEIAEKLFGLNAFYRLPGDLPLLEEVADNGMLLIENIHLLSRETQEALAETLKYGFFKPLKSERKIKTEMQLLVSSSYNLETLVQENLFSPALLAELTHISLKAPSTFSTQDIQELREIAAFGEEELPTFTLDAVQNRVHAILHQKEQTQEFHPVMIDSKKHDNPALDRILEKGKDALKDKEAMTFLWNTFKSQAKIASLLKVNRSSVHKRCKEFNLN